MADLVLLSRVLLYGRPETRRALIEKLVEDDDLEIWQVLADTVRADGSWTMRTRCLEALGTGAVSADRESAERILAAICGTDGAVTLGEDQSANPLSPREREVAALVARGLSNREIAGYLAISAGTVRAHLQHILSKLKVRKRAAIGAWIGRRATRS